MLKWLGGSSATSSGGNGAADNLTHVGKVFTIEEYQVVVEELIAEGGFAVVYRARSPKGHQYALKRMAVNNEQDLYLAKQEIAITKALSDCPHSVTYISSTIHSTSPDVHEVLILLQLYTGQSVVDLLNARLSKRSSLSEHEALRIFSSVVIAVGRLHHRTKPIIHRDLKIENILSDKHGNYILCDYGSCTVNSMHPETMGAAKCEDEIARFTTLAYRAPEMVSLYSGKTITTKADIWALGCLLYKLCFMNTPFGEQPLAIVSAQFTIPENSPFSDEVHSLIRYMLESDPDKRPTVWQVSEVLCRMQGRPNPMPNVFRSPKPPAVLPRPRKANEKKSLSPTGRNSTQSTPANMKPKVGISVTTTSISSRERPKARLGPGHRPTSSSASSIASAQSISRHQSSTPPPRRTSNRQVAAPSIGRAQHLQAEEDWRAHSKSWDSGLDMFGAVPFSTPNGQERTEAVSNSSPNDFDEVRCDLFGCTPFVSSTSPAPSNSQSPPTVHPPSPNQGLDDFGAIPFVTCS